MEGGLAFNGVDPWTTEGEPEIDGNCDCGAPFNGLAPGVAFWTGVPLSGEPPPIGVPLPPEPFWGDDEKPMIL